MNSLSAKCVVRRVASADLVRGDLVEVARQPMAAALRVAHHLARFQERSQLVVEIVGVDDFQTLVSALVTTHTHFRPAY